MPAISSPPRSVAGHHPAARVPTSTSGGVGRLTTRSYSRSQLVAQSHKLGGQRRPYVTKKLYFACAFAGAAIAAAGAAAALQGDPGVSSNSILIGGTAPLSGEASSGAGVARG